MNILASEPPASWSRLNPYALLAAMRLRLLSGLLLLVASLLLAITMLHVVTHKYSAELLIVPSEQPDPSLPASVAGLGSLVGLDMSGDNPHFALYADAVTTRQVADALAADPKILHGIFPEQWDEGSGSWHESRSVSRKLFRSLKALLGIRLEPWHQPGAREVQEYLVKKIKVTEEKRRPITRILYAHQDPQFAAYLLGKVSRETDRFLREQSIVRTSAYITYLERRIQDVTIAEQRQSLAQLISSYEKSRMLASSGAPFAADQFGEITVSKEPTSPNPYLVLVVFVFVGLLLWVLITVMSILRSPS